MISVLDMCASWLSQASTRQRLIVCLGMPFFTLLIAFISVRFPRSNFVIVPIVSILIIDCICEMWVNS